MSRLADVFQAARKERRAAFVAYVTAGDPAPDHTVGIVRALRRGGADVVELGIPFSDPIADGPTNQRAAERALEAGMTPRGVIETVAAIRSAGEDLPVVLFTYANPVVQYGVRRFAEDAASAGADGVLLTDVPVEEMERFRPAFTAAGLDPVLLVTPTSTKERIRAAARLSRGFLYYVSRTGVTGVQTHLGRSLDTELRAVKKLSKLPVAVGFGISSPRQVAEAARLADGVVVGSAIVDQIARIGANDALADTIQRFVTPLAEACRRR